MEEIDYFDAVAGKIVGGALRYVLLLALGGISTMTFLAATIATVASLRSAENGVPDIGDLLPILIIVGVVILIAGILRIFRIEPLTILRRAIAAVRGELVLSIIALASIYVLLFH